MRDAELTVRQNLLHLSQPLLRLRHQRALGIFEEKRLELALGALRLVVVAVGFLHHLIMGHADLHLRVGGFIEKREEHDEILVLFDGLRQIGSPALFVKGVRHAELGFGEIFAVRVGVDQRLEAQAAFGELAAPDILEGAFVEYLIGLGGAGFSWIPLFFVEVRALSLQDAILVFMGASAMWGVSGVFFGRLADRGWSRPLIVFGGLGTGVAYLAFVLWGFVPGAIGFLILYAFLWPAGGQVPMTFLGQRLGSNAQRTELGLLENMFLAGDATGAVLIGFLSGMWTLTLALALIPGAVTLVAGVLFAWQYGIARTHHTVAPGGAE